MKKNTKIFIITAVAAVILIGLMLLLIFLPSSEDGDATYDEGIKMNVTVDDDGVHQAEIITDKNGEIENNSYGVLVEYDTMEISSIHLENKKGTLDITSYTPTNENGETDTTQYTVKGYEDYELQPGIADLIASSAAQLDFSKVMTLEKAKAAEYGLDNPRATVNVTYSDKTKAVIYVGDDAPQNAGTYIKFGDGDAVYFVTSDSVSAFDYGLTDLMSLTINDSASDSDNSQASSIKLYGSAFSKEIELVPNESDKNSASYKIVKPSEGYASESESSLVEGAIRGLYADSVKMVNPSSSQLSKLGLSEPYAAVSAVYPDITVDIISSKPDSDGNVYIMKKGGNIVYVMTAEKLPWVTTSYEKLQSEYVLSPKMTSLSQVSINNGSKTYNFTLSSKDVTTTDDDGNETTSTVTTVKYNNKEIDEAYFSTLFQNISYTELADRNDSSESKTAVLTVTYTYESDNSSDTVTFYDTGESRYFVSVNGNSVGHVHKSAINKVVKQVSDVAANKNVDSVF